MTLTQARLQELLSYVPDTGEFTRKVARKGAKAGSIAGYVNNHGYIVFWVDNRPHQAHRLAWLYMTGTWPKGQIHHENKNKTDNRIVNLADVTCRENNSNKQRHSEGALVGVTFVKGRNICRARIGINGKNKHLGYYDTPEEASAVYQIALAKLTPT